MLLTRLLHIFTVSILIGLPLIYGADSSSSQAPVERNSAPTRFNAPGGALNQLFEALQMIQSYIPQEKNSENFF